LSSEQVSPGEVRKLFLALGILRGPQVIMLDEPTNHLDLPSIEALEVALSDCPCALICVSHDKPFLKTLGGQSWRITRSDRTQIGSHSVLETFPERQE